MSLSYVSVHKRGIPTLACPSCFFKAAFDMKTHLKLRINGRLFVVVVAALVVSRQNEIKFKKNKKHFAADDPIHNKTKHR